jgi:hypothetical protein
MNKIDITMTRNFWNYIQNEITDNYSDTVVGIVLITETQKDSTIRWQLKEFVNFKTNINIYW